MRIIYFVDNKLGGVTSLNFNLTSFITDTDIEQWVIHIDLEELKMAKANMIYPVNKNITFTYSAFDNVYHVIHNLYQLIPEEAGVLVVNYELEMEMLDHFEVNQTVYQLVHDEYNLRLSIKYSHVVDIFIAHNQYIFERLQRNLPDRKKDIYYLPHGVKVPSIYRVHEPVGDTKPIKLLFLGRMSSSKGIFDLPRINEILNSKKIEFEWICIGNGPELEDLKKGWDAIDKVEFISPASNDEVIMICSKQDIFVLPTKFEGSPVSLIETMSVGVVPVITDLPGSIQEIVDKDIGFRITEGDNFGFASAIETLSLNRTLLGELGKTCRQKIEREFDIKLTSLSYIELFRQFSKRRKDKLLKKSKIGARLDQPWISPLLTRFLRKISNW